MIIFRAPTCNTRKEKKAKQNKPLLTQPEFCFCFGFFSIQPVQLLQYCCCHYLPITENKMHIKKYMLTSSVLLIFYQKHNFRRFFFFLVLFSLIWLSEESHLHSKRADGAGKLVFRAWLVVQAADQNHVVKLSPSIFLALL